MERVRASVFPSDQTKNAAWIQDGSQSVGDKFHRREGNSPDRQIRPLSVR